MCLISMLIFLGWLSGYCISSSIFTVSSRSGPGWGCVKKSLKVGDKVIVVSYVLLTFSTVKHFCIMWLERFKLRAQLLYWPLLECPTFHISILKFCFKINFLFLDFYCHCYQHCWTYQLYTMHIFMRCVNFNKKELLYY